MLLVSLPRTVSLGPDAVRLPVRSETAWRGWQASHRQAPPARAQWPPEHVGRRPLQPGAGPPGTRQGGHWCTHTLVPARQTGAASAYASGAGRTCAPETTPYTPWKECHPRRSTPPSPPRQQRRSGQAGSPRPPGQRPSQTPPPLAAHETCWNGDGQPTKPVTRTRQATWGASQPSCTHDTNPKGEEEQRSEELRQLPNRPPMLPRNGVPPTRCVANKPCTQPPGRHEVVCVQGKRYDARLCRRAICVLTVLGRVSGVIYRQVEPSPGLHEGAAHALTVVVSGGERNGPG